VSRCEPIRVIAYSDYLCPWCFNATVRLRRLEVELAGRIEIVWRSYLLRPEPNGARDLEKFRSYTKGWQRPGAEPDAGTFRVWQGDEGPPSHSVPPHLVARAAAELGRAEFDAVHERLFSAYFAENHDITRTETLRAIWGECGLADHKEAIDIGIHGVPAVRIDPNPIAAVGAQPLDAYRRWFLKELESA
jgi:predicted DsbA family dithiol-disulfide isomerase